MTEGTSRIGWLDCASGVSGDMLLGALVDVGVPLAVIQRAVDDVLTGTGEHVRLSAHRVQRGAVAATQVRVEGTDSRTHRPWSVVRDLLDATEVPGIDAARACFTRLAEVEAQVHGVGIDDVHLHEVGALDAIADIVGVCAGFTVLGLSALTCSPVALGGGTARTAHGRLPVPGPAVVGLLSGAPSYGGPVEVELATPTGAALLVGHVDRWGFAPPMTGTVQGFGAGSRDLPGHPNVVRLVIGSPWHASGPRRTGPDGVSDLIEVQATVDDLDPRVWPQVIDALIGVGALDAWLVPALARKGRPAQVLHAIVVPDLVEAVRTAVFTHTSTLGVRSYPVQRHALPRRSTTVTVQGHPVSVKIAELDGRVINAQPEWDEVVAVAAALGRPARWVLARAAAAATDQIG